MSYLTLLYKQAPPQKLSTAADGVYIYSKGIGYIRMRARTRIVTKYTDIYMPAFYVPQLPATDKSALVSVGLLDKFGLYFSAHLSCYHNDDHTIEFPLKKVDTGLHAGFLYEWNPVVADNEACEVISLSYDRKVTSVLTYDSGPITPIGDFGVHVVTRSGCGIDTPSTIPDTSQAGPILDAPISDGAPRVEAAEPPSDDDEFDAPITRDS